jgi:hypothetical protein
MTSSDGGWSLNVVYTVSSDGANIYIMYTRHHFVYILFFLIVWVRSGHVFFD